MKNILRAALSLMIAGSAVHGAPSKNAPNMVFILADDLGWMDTGVYQRRFEKESYYETPNIDRLASQGMLFTQAYVSPMCSPTRAMLLTGKNNAVTGILKATYECPHDDNYDEIVNPNSWQGNREFAVLPAPNHMVLDGSYQTFAEILKPQGYNCGFLGKWHVGYHNKIPSATPMVQGFNVIAYYDTGGSPYRDWLPQWEKFGKPMDQPRDRYMTVAESHEACRFIEENRKDRFLLYYCTGAVHSPWEDDPASGYREHFERKGRTGWMDDRCDPYPVYAAMVKSLDDAVGAVLDKLDSTRGPEGRPLSENTLVIFLSDNGGINREQFSRKDGPLYNKAITSNFPLRGAKGNVYDGGIRVPFIVRWPGVTTSQSVCDVPVTGQDICSLLMEASGLEKQKDAGSILALLKNPQDATEYGRDTFFYHFPFWWPHAEAGTSLENDVPASAVRKGKYKLVYSYTGGLELYNLEKDISEKHNLVSAMPEKTEELRTLLENWLKTEVDPRYIPEKNPKFNPSKTPYGEFRDVMNLWSEPSSTDSRVIVFLDNGSCVPGSSNSDLPFKNGDRDVAWDVTAAQQPGLRSIGAAVMSVRMVPFNIFANSRGADTGGCNGLAVQTGTQPFWMDGKTAEAALFQFSFYRDTAKTEKISGVKITFESLTSRIGAGGSQMMMDAYAGSGALEISDNPRADDRVVSLDGRKLLAADDPKNSFVRERGLKAVVEGEACYCTMPGNGTLSFGENDSFWLRRRTPIGIEDVAYQLGRITFNLSKD